jgi:hypothetical protein
MLSLAAIHRWRGTPADLRRAEQLYRTVQRLSNVDDELNQAKRGLQELNR